MKQEWDRIYRIKGKIHPRVYNQIKKLQLKTLEVVYIYYQLGQEKNLKPRKTYQEIHEVSGKKIIFYFRKNENDDIILIQLKETKSVGKIIHKKYINPKKREG